MIADETRPDIIVAIKAMGERRNLKINCIEGNFSDLLVPGLIGKCGKRNIEGKGIRSTNLLGILNVRHGTLL